MACRRTESASVDVQIKRPGTVSRYQRIAGPLSHSQARPSLQRSLLGDGWGCAAQGVRREVSRISANLPRVAAIPLYLVIALALDPSASSPALLLLARRQSSRGPHQARSVQQSVRLGIHPVLETSRKESALTGASRFSLHAAAGPPLLQKPTHLPPAISSPTVPHLWLALSSRNASLEPSWPTLSLVEDRHCPLASAVAILSLREADPAPRAFINPTSLLSLQYFPPLSFLPAPRSLRADLLLFPSVSPIRTG
ncbi:hypothetical protein BDV96DRAFT_235845 [Lophiotrema nucula]|uniref:Uncharacterized protein n=1 Tax=Lophiotrema nucula TaxID=690887 RepID=A0A6A5YQY5_9PLEO|nr:hypothetical protein BDV96DRAFT_235845 [Lophiotrema nucula]